MQIKFEFTRMANSFDDDYLSYVFSILNLLNDHHITILTNNDAILMASDKGDLRLVIPSHSFDLFDRRDIYRLLTAGLNRIWQTLHSYNKDIVNEMGDFADTLDLTFSQDFQNPLFKKKSFGRYLNNFKHMDFDDQFEEDGKIEDFLCRAFQNNFWQLTPYKETFLDL